MANVVNRAWLLFKVLTFVCQICVAGIADARPRCEKRVVYQNRNESRVDVLVGTRTISFLGWEHLSPDHKQETLISHGLSMAVKAALQNDCSAVREQLFSVVQNQQNHLQPAVQLIDQLKRLDAQIPIDVMAVEHSSETWELANRNMVDHADAIEFIAVKCPQVHNLARSFAVISPGPEYLFRLSKKGTVKAEPVEDEKVRKKTIDLANELFSLPEIKPSDLNDEARNLVNTNRSKMMFGEMITDEEIRKAVQAQGPNPTGRLLEKQQKLLQQIMANNPPRNQKIVENLLKGQGNYVMAIGNSHVVDLSEQLFQACLKGDVVTSEQRSITEPTLGADGVGEAKR